MGNHVKARPRAKPKPKSIKAKVNRKMGSKRRLSRMGKEVKKGHKGVAASYLTRAQVLRRLQISLRDFRRLCILKGVYPRDPSKKASGKDKTYYHIKDVGFLAHEPILQSFRDFKAFMKKLRRTIGRKNIKDAQRRELNERPVYKLDHLVKERYPRFLDAVRDLDDALSLVHLFASLPQMRRQTSAHTQTCKRLVKEWAFYVSKAKCLSKVFVSIKGIYFQAEVMGQPVTWVTPHMFTTRYPRDVDFSIMLTFLEFYETLLKFAMFKLFHTLNLRYPPTLDAELDGADAGLSTLKTQSLEGVSGEGEREDQEDGEEPEEEEHRVLPSTKGERREAKRKLKEEAKKLKDILADDGAGGEEERRKRLFKGLKFFFGREVPKGWLELVVSACGGVVGWEGEGSPFKSSDPGITHQDADEEEEEGEGAAEDRVVDVVPGVATDVSDPRGGGDEDGDEEHQEEEAFAKELERERAGTTFSKAKELEEQDDGSESDDDDDDDGEGDEDEESDSSSDEEGRDGDEEVEEAEEDGGPAAEAVEEKQTEEQEHQEMSRNMMSKKAKRLYGRMQHGLSKRREEVERLKAKRKKLEAQYDAAEGMAKKSSSKKKSKKRRLSSSNGGGES
eukprot:g11162.t1